MYKFISQFMTMFLLISQVLVWISAAIEYSFSFWAGANRDEGK